jgi:hypothetical protein
MKELLESIWNAPKEQIIKEINTAIMAGVIVVIIAWILIYIFIIRD